MQFPNPDLSIAVTAYSPQLRHCHRTRTIATRVASSLPEFTPRLPWKPNKRKLEYSSADLLDRFRPVYPRLYAAHLVLQRDPETLVSLPPYIRLFQEDQLHWTSCIVRWLV